MRAVLVLMMTIICVSRLVWSRHLLIKTAEVGEDDGAGGADYNTGLGEPDTDTVLDCSTDSDNYYCRHIAQLFSQRRAEMET